MFKFFLVLVILALATYFLTRAFQQRGLMPERSPRPVRPTRPVPPKMIAPDDDEDFLRDLDRKRLNPEDPEG